MQGDGDNKTSERMKARYDGLAGKVTMCGSITQPRLNKSHQNSNPYRVVTQLNVVVYRIQSNLQSRTMVVNLDRLTPYQGTIRDEWP
jgi:hypothetical protein